MFHPWTLLATLRKPARALDRVTLVHHRYLDRIIAQVTHHPLFFPTGFFCDGWGNLFVPPALIELIQAEAKFTINPIKELRLTQQKKRKLITRSIAHVIGMEKETMNKKKVLAKLWTLMNKQEIEIINGTFETTFKDAQRLLPEESRQVQFELVLPKEILEQEQNRNGQIEIDGCNTPFVVLLPGTGEHGCTHRRKSIAEPLAQQGVAVLILEGPFYGQRKPKDQKGSKLRRSVKIMRSHKKSGTMILILLFASFV